MSNKRRFFVFLLLSILFVTWMPFAANAEEPFKFCPEKTTLDVQTETGIFVVRSAENNCTWRWNAEPGTQNLKHVPAGYVVVDMNTGAVYDENTDVDLASFVIILKVHYTANQLKAVEDAEIASATQPDDPGPCGISANDAAKIFSAAPGGGDLLRRVQKIKGEVCAFTFRGAMKGVKIICPSGWICEYQVLDESNDAGITDEHVKIGDDQAIDAVWGLTARKIEKYVHELKSLPPDVQPANWECIQVHKAYMLGWTDTPQFKVVNENVPSCDYSQKLMQFFVDKAYPGKNIQAPATLEELWPSS